MNFDLNQSYYNPLSEEFEEKVKLQIGTLSKPTSFGPGGWSIIHILAKWAKTSERIETFIMIIDVIISTLFCIQCREHAITYLKNNPPSKYSLIKNIEGRLIGMFLWSWEFHNIVNSRLGKSILAFDTAFNIYPEYD